MKASTHYCSDPEDPKLMHIHEERLANRTIDRLLGICEFILMDGYVDEHEAQSLYAWVKDNSAFIDTWPMSVLHDRLCDVFDDGVADENELHDLLSLVKSIARPRKEDGNLAVSTLPFNDPAPVISFPGRRFCFTGVFDYGSRSQCQAAIEARLGIVSSGVTKNLDFLVVGNVGSEVWKHTSFGNKIEKAVGYRDTGLQIAIISEAYWVENL